MTKRSVIPNQIFIGCPWKTIRSKYSKFIDNINKKFPLSFIMYLLSLDWLRAVKLRLPYT